MSKKVGDAPEGVRIIAFFYFITAFAAAMFVPLVISFADRLRVDGGASLLDTPLSGLTFNAVLLGGILLAAAAVLSYFIGRDLLLGKNWPRILMGIFLVLGILMALLGFRDGLLFSGLFKIALNCFILWYLFVNGNTKKFFS